MTLATVLDGAGVTLLVLGCALATVGLYGLILKPDLFEQLHAAGLVTGPGVILVLLASLGTGSAEIITSAILVIAFVLVTSSISTHVIAHAGAWRYRGTATGASTPMDRSGPDEAVAPPGGSAGERRRSGEALRVVIAHDGSAGADVAVALAAAIDWRQGTVLRLVSAVGADEMPASVAPRQGPRGSGAAGSRTVDDALLDRAAGTVARPGIPVETVLRLGDPADIIVDEITSLGADLLIAGARRRGIVQSLLGWSAAGEIVDRAPCPVLVARSTALRTVLLATDGSPQSVAATDVVARWPIFDLTRIHVVSVAPSPGGEEQRTVGSAAARLADAGRDVVGSVLRGRPAEEIVRSAVAHSVDVVVVGSRGRTGLGRTLLGSVAGEVLASAPCSVLIVAPPVRRPGSAG